MTPVLFNRDAKVFDSNGIGKLSSAEDCTVIEATNSKFELEVKYPVKGLHFEQICHDAIILTQPAPDKDPQPFRVYRITKPLSGRVMVYAKHLAYDAAGITTDPFSLVGPKMAFQAMKDNASVDCPFTFTTDIESEKIIATSVPKDIWTLMGNSKGSMLDVFGGEYLFDGYNISLLKRRGEDRGVTVRYGKNLTSLEQDENISNCYTAVHPYWTSSAGEFVQLSERVVKCKGNFTHVKVMPLDASKAFDSKPTQAQLREYANQYIVDNNVGKPKVSWKISYVQLEQTEEYRGKAVLDRVYLGDTVSVEYAALGVSAKARVNEVRYKPLLGRYESVSLGDVKANMASTIVGNKDYADQAAQNAIDRQTQLEAFNKLTNGGQDQGIFRDNDGKIYLNLTYAKAGTLDCGTVNVINFNAQSVNAGKLRSLNGMSYFDLDTGKFISVGPNQDAVCMQNGHLWLENSAGNIKIWLMQNGEFSYIYCFDDDGNVLGGIGVFGNHFTIMAPDEALDGTISGHPAIWKTINGEKVLTAVT